MKTPAPNTTPPASPSTSLPALPQTPAQWKAHLASRQAEPMAYAVTREAATERPHTGRYADHWQPGRYHCICCGALLFESNRKFDAHCGWPSFDQPAEPAAISESRDTSHGMIRTETRCAACQAHLGHLFDDGPTDTGLRYCINSAALSFNPEDDTSSD